MRESNILNNNTKIIYSYIKKRSIYYKQAVNLRYTVFFSEFGLSKDIVCDNPENDSIHFAAIKEDKVIGYGRLAILNNEAQISQMVVNSNMKGKGIGSKIIEELINRSRKKNCSIIFLLARIEAVHFYEKFGFKCIGKELPSKKTGLPHIRMEKTSIDIRNK